MAIDINKHEVDIDILFKQNENDLSSIKELYRKLKELEQKIIQIKYIDSNLADKLKKDYEKLKRIILDENIQAELTNSINEINTQLNNDINEINSQLDTKASKKEIFTMSNMGQDIREAMTGGSVAVVGVNAILEENIVDNQVTPIKTSFMEETSKSSNLFNYKTVTLGKYLSASSGGERENVDYLYSDFVKVENGENISLTECYNTIVTYYNTNKEFVSGESIGNNPNGKTINITNNGYIRVSLRYLNMSGVTEYDYTKFAICKGNTATYEPYGSKIKLKDEYIQDVIDNITELKKINKNKNYIVVAKKGGDYNNLTEAVTNANGTEIIVVMPGVYENEVVEAWGKTIYVIGISKTDCIIKNSTGDYHTPPLEASSGLFKNLTIIHEKKTNTTGINGYAVHIEDNDTANKNLVFENCYIESQNNWGIGMGMRGGCYVEFNKCDLVGNDNSHGGLFFHDSAIDEYLGKQTIRCIDTNIFSIGTNTNDLKIQSQCKDGSTVNVEFIRTNVRNITNGKQTKVFLNDNNGVYTNVANIEDLTNFNLSKSSYGNSMEILNY